MPEENLKKIHVDLPNHWAIDGESMWAEELGNDLYRIENVPFHAYGLNYRDVVRAAPDSSETIPEIREVVEPSGRRTIRVFFDKAVDQVAQSKLLDEFKQYDASYEPANDRLIAIDIKSEGSYGAVYDQLEEWIEAGLLEFETCEARAPGSFDNVEDTADGAAWQCAAPAFWLPSLSGAAAC